MDSLKQFAINLTFAIIGLALTFGLVGLTVFMSHWYSLVNDPLITETIGSKWKHFGLTASIFLTLSVVTAVLSFSFEWTIVFLGVSGVLQVPAFIFVCIVISYTTKQDSTKTAFIENFSKASTASNYSGVWGCHNTSTDRDTEGNAVCSTSPEESSPCCDARISNLVYHITKACTKWLVGLLIIWIVSLILLIPMSIFFCETGHKESEN